MHSACWDHGVELDNKTIGVIGTGSTSVQIVPQLQKIAKEVQVYMRSPTWISPPFGAGALTTVKKGQDEDLGQRQYEFTEEDKKKFREDPEFHLKFRKGIEAEINGKIPALPQFMGACVLTDVRSLWHVQARVRALEYFPQSHNR